MVKFPILLNEYKTFTLILQSSSLVSVSFCYFVSLLFLFIMPALLWIFKNTCPFLAQDRT